MYNVDASRFGGLEMFGFFAITVDSIYTLISRLWSVLWHSFMESRKCCVFFANPVPQSVAMMQLKILISILRDIWWLLFPLFNLFLQIISPDMIAAEIPIFAQIFANIRIFAFYQKIYQNHRSYYRLLINVRACNSFADYFARTPSKDFNLRRSRSFSTFSQLILLFFFPNKHTILDSAGSRGEWSQAGPKESNVS